MVTRAAVRALVVVAAAAAAARADEPEWSVGSVLRIGSEASDETADREGSDAPDAARWTATWTAVDVAARTPAGRAVAGGAAPLLDETSALALREAIAEGDAVVRRRVVLVGRDGALRHGDDAVTRSLSAQEEDDGAIGVSVAFPVAGSVRTGLRTRVRVGGAGAGRWRVLASFAWSGAMRVAAAERVEGEVLDDVGVNVFAAESAFDVRGGETAAFRALAADGSARIVLLRIDGAAPEEASDPQWPEEAADRAGAALRPVLPWEEERPAAPSSASHGAGAAEVAHRDGRRVAIPVAPGAGFGVLAGALETAAAGIASIPGCDASLLVRAEVEVRALGLAATGVGADDGTLDVRVTLRDRVAGRTYDAVGRRGLAGHLATAPFAVRLPLREERTVVADASAAAGGSPVGTSLTARFTPPRGAPRSSSDAPPPVTLRVGDGALAVRPGRTASLAEHVARERVRRWTSEGWCGMRARFPVADAVREGSSVTLRLSDDGRAVGVDAEIRGAPERLGTVDPLDGAVEIVREPVLRYRAEPFGPPADGRVAWAGPLAVRVALPASAASASGRVRVAVGADAGFVAGAAAATFGAGGETVLPVAHETYSSNHETGEVATDFRVVEDGVRAALDGDADGDGARSLAVESRTRPAWTQHVLRKSTVPPREGETHTGLVHVRRAVRRGVFPVVPARGFRRAATNPLDLPDVAVVPEGESR